MARQSQGAWYRKGTNAWYTTVGGKQVALGVQGKGNRKAAREAWLRLMANSPAPEGTPPKRSESAQEPEKATPVSVKQLVLAFLADVTERARPKTVEVYRYLLGNFAERFGDRRAAEVRPYEAETESRKQSWSASTRHSYLAAVVTAFRWGVRARLIDGNPLDGVRKPQKASRGVKAVVSAEQFAALSAAASPAFRTFLIALWQTGCRPGELARIEAKDVDFKAAAVVLAEHKTAEKTGRPRAIFLAPEALTLFRTLADKHPTGPLFRNKRGGAWTGWSVVKATEAARKKAGLPHAIAYGMRHSFATDALANGVPDATVASLLGHSNTAMLHKHYAHLTAKAGVLRNAAALVRPGPAPGPIRDYPEALPA